MELEDLKSRLKLQVIEYLNLIDVKPEDIKDDEPFFGGSLDLDSIDSLELVVLLEREYAIKIENPQEGRKVMKDINHMAEYIFANQK
jgi:acyl carrier protein